MTQRTCPRCRTVLEIEDEGVLVFCWSCGTPQVRLSEEILAQAAEQALAEAAAASHAEFAPASRIPNGSETSVAATASTVDWPGAIRCAALAGAVTLGILTLEFLLPALGLLALLWAMVAPIVVLGLYSTRFSKTQIRPGFGARLGLLTGLAIVAATSVVNVLQLVVTRFVMHSPKEIDSLVNTLLGQMTNPPPGQPPFPLASSLNVPEFRAGVLLFLFSVGTLMYLVFSTAGGAFGGLMRSRAPKA